MRIFILGNGGRPGVREQAEQLRPLLRQHCEIVVEDLDQKEDLSEYKADIALVLGGDGSILRAARQMGYRQTPVLGINLGRLGFLADLTLEEFRACIACVIGREFRVTNHLMFECTLTGTDGERRFLGLNEVAILTAPPFHMIDLALFIDGEQVSDYCGDGLIISTPVGSTAHNLSAGGPILGQELAAFVLTPICPHSLTNRPVVDSADKEYMIVVRHGPGDSAILVIDGQELIPLSEGQRVTIRRAPVKFGLVKVPGRSYFQTLRDKLRWGTPPNYRSEPAGVNERNKRQ